MLSKKSFGVVVFSVKMSNPNGNIEDGRPRVSGDTGAGWISSYSMHRKLRDQLADHESPATKELFKEMLSLIHI